MLVLTVSFLSSIADSRFEPLTASDGTCPDDVFPEVCCGDRISGACTGCSMQQCYDQCASNPDCESYSLGPDYTSTHDPTTYNCNYYTSSFCDPVSECLASVTNNEGGFLVTERPDGIHSSREGCNVWVRVHPPSPSSPPRAPPFPPQFPPSLPPFPLQWFLAPDATSCTNHCVAKGGVCNVDALRSVNPSNFESYLSASVAEMSFPMDGYFEPYAHRDVTTVATMQCSNYVTYDIDWYPSYQRFENSYKYCLHSSGGTCEAIPSQPTVQSTYNRICACEIAPSPSEPPSMSSPCAPPCPPPYPPPRPPPSPVAPCTPLPLHEYAAGVLKCDTEPYSASDVTSVFRYGGGRVVLSTGCACSP